jgi:hypothetical protein
MGVIRRREASTRRLVVIKKAFGRCRRRRDRRHRRSFPLRLPARLLRLRGFIVEIEGTEPAFPRFALLFEV